MSENASAEVGACQCEEALEHLFEFVDAELPEGDLCRLSAHIESCATCQAAVGREKELRVLLKRSCTEVAPDSLRVRVMTQLTVLRASKRG